MKKLKILVLDDDLDIVELVEYILQQSGFNTVGILNSREILSLIQKEDFSLLIIDRNLPCIEGTQLVRNLRSQEINIPVIFLTAKDSKKEKTEGFLSGGDDYITKPFDNEELVLRVKAIIKRLPDNNSNVNIMQYRDIVLNIDYFEVKIQNKIIELTKLEYNLLKTFILNKNIVLDRDYLLDRVWQCDIFDNKCNEKTVNVAIKRLKEKIDPDKTKKYIKSVRGIGYKLA